MSEQYSQQGFDHIPQEIASQAQSHEDLVVCVSKKDCPSPHSFNNKLGRVLWGITWLVLFRPSPRIFHFWRRSLLRLFGAKIGASAKIDPSARIWVPWNLEMKEEATLGHHVDCYNIAMIIIGRHATVSQYAFLCTATHETDDPNMKLVSSSIVLEDQSWVCAGAFISPGVTLGVGSIAGARAVVTRSIEPWTIVAGNPARVIKQRKLRHKINK